MAKQKQATDAKIKKTSEEASGSILGEFGVSSKSSKADTVKTVSASAKEDTGKHDASEKAVAKKSPRKADKPQQREPSYRDTVRASTGGAASEKQAKRDLSAPIPAARNEQPRSARPAHRIIPYVLIVVAVFLGVSLLLNVFCNRGNVLESDPASHWMGLIGYYLCYGLFGTFGPAVFVLPILLLNLAFFWKRYVDNRILISKFIASLLFLVLFSALIHTFYLIPEKRDIPTEHLLYYGARMVSGGIVGGKLSYLLVSYLNVVGTIVLSLCLLAVTLFYCLGMTPQLVWNHLRAARAIKRAERAEARDEEERRKEEAKKERAEKPSVPTDKRAPMPMPTLDPSGGTRPFVPADVSRKMAEEAKTSQGQPTGTGVAEKPIDGTPQRAPSAVNPAKNRDSAIDPIFPQSADARQTRRVPKEDRNFDLKNVFINLDDKSTPSERSYAKLPPEVPLRSGQQRPAPASTRTAGASGANPASPARTPATESKRTPMRANAPTKAGDGAIVRRSAAGDGQDYGLTPEEFERLEAEKGVRAGSKNPKAAPSLKSVKPAAEKSGKGQDSAPKVSKTGEKKYVFPPISYLHPAEPMTPENEEEIRACVRLLEETLQNFRVNTTEIDYAYGPTVTRYEVFPAPGVRVRSFVNLADDIALALASGGIRIEAPIPGKSAVGIEVPNKTRCTVFLRQLVESKAFRDSKSRLTACLGADITGKPLIFDIAKMPHLLVAGTTGSGKSVCINCVIMSLLYKARPDEVKLVLIDPKKVEFSVYKNIPHLMAPIVTTPKDAAGALQAAVEEMERRFELFEQVGVPNLAAYNEITKDDPDMPFKPHIVIIIDELADLMMTASDEVETAICRIAQKARAAGIHLIVGTQRPSVDVVTGLIKSNIPSRIAFTVASQVDSKTILDYAGAEKLAGRGDMLFAPIGAMKPARVQGAFVDEKEVERICEFLRATNGTAQFDETFISKLKELAAQCGSKNKGGGMDALPTGEGADGKGDQKYVDAVRVAVEEKRISTSLLQRKLEIGYSRAAKIIDRMQAEGLVSAPDGAKPRTVLITPEEFISKFIENADSENGEGEG